MAEGLPEDIDFIQDGTFINVGMVRLMATMSAIFLWALSLWWFGIAAVAVIQSPPKYFHLGWWAMVFPNTGFTLATISIARSLGSKAIGWFATGMSIVILSAFAFIFYSHVRAVISQDIMYPGRDEDVEDH
jgi:tellurite resistance protein TehA-like permease